MLFGRRNHGAINMLSLAIFAVVMLRWHCAQQTNFTKPSSVTEPASPANVLQQAQDYARSMHDAQLMHLVQLSNASFDSAAAWRSLKQALAEFGSDGVARSTFHASITDYFALHLLNMISHSGLGKLVPCSSDVDLPGVPNKRYVIASNVHNSGELMPNYILQLLRIILSAKPEQIHVAIYESGSTDDTVRWLHVLRVILRVSFQVMHSLF
jgi:hypothetical protein